MKTRSELKRDYVNAPAPMGVLVIRNTTSNRFQVRASRNLRGSLNRARFEITPSTNPNVELLNDWRALGAAGFEIRVLDELKPKDVPGWCPDDDLEELRAMWHARLMAEGGDPY